MFCNFVPICVFFCSKCNYTMLLVTLNARKIVSLLLLSSLNSIRLRRRCGEKREGKRSNMKLLSLSLQFFFFHLIFFPFNKKLFLIVNKFFSDTQNSLKKQQRKISMPLAVVLATNLCAHFWSYIQNFIYLNFEGKKTK